MTMLLAKRQLNMSIPSELSLILNDAIATNISGRIKYNTAEYGKPAIFPGFLLFFCREFSVIIEWIEEASFNLQ